MTPWWKLRREFRRIGQRIRSVPELVWEPLAQLRHDKLVAAGLPVTTGRQPLLPKVALVLIYQPAGLSDSLMRLCRHLGDNGYAVLAVCNSTLTQTDRDKLAAWTWRIIERPNFGYDFGGYRDGLKFLQRSGVAPQRLAIVNDSIWFPLAEGDTTLARMEASPFDIAGTVLRERGEERFLESYLYVIGPKALQHPAFAAFWKNYRLTSNKFKVIRRGERGFGEAMLSAGLTLGGMFTTAQFQQGIASADEAALRQILAYTASADPVLVAQATDLAQQDGDGWATRARNFVTDALRQGQFYSTFPVGAVRIMAYPVMKKSREPVSACWRAAWLAAVANGILPAPPEPLLAEIRALSAGEAA